MQFKNYLFAVPLLLMMAATESYGQCPPSSKMYNFAYMGHTYYVVMEKANYADAMACAASMNGHLADIASQAEQDTVYGAIRAAGVTPSYATVPDGGNIAYVWIGASDAQTEGTWKWSDGTTFWMGQGAAGTGGGAPVGGMYNNWGGTDTGIPNEPDNYSNIQDGAAIALASWPAGGAIKYGIAGEWNDISQTNSLYYVVEVDMTTGINNQSPLSHQVDVYPNPAVGTIHISGEEITELTVVNTAGQVVKTATFNAQQTVTIETDDMAVGSYYLLITDGEIQYRKPIAIAR